MSVKRQLVVAAAIAALGVPAAPALAQGARFATGGSIAAAEQGARTEAASRASVESLFARLCPGRCELLDLSVEVGEPSATDALSPGFEPTTPGGYQVQVKRIRTTVLLDAKLPADFQRNIPRLIRYRLGAFAPVVDVRREVLAFPEPQAEPAPPALAEPPPVAPPAPEPPVEEPTEEAVPEEAAPELPWTFHLMWLAPLFATLLLALLLLLLIRRALRILQDATRPAADAPGTSGAATGTGAADAPDLPALRRDLSASRSVRNKVLRRWLGDDPNEVAVLIRLLGPELLADLRGDPALAAALGAVAAEVARNPEPPAAEETRRVANAARARLTAMRVTEADGEGDWGFLEGTAGATLDRALRTFDGAERAEILTHVPPGQRAAYVERLSESGRRELLMATAGLEPGDRESAGALAARVRAEVERLAPAVSDGRTAALVDLLDTLPPEDQAALLRDLHARQPEVARSVLSRTVLEEACLDLPGEILVEAVHRLPVETVVRFLRGTRVDISERVRALLPAGRRPAIEAELSLDIPLLRADQVAARRQFTRAVREVLVTNGEDPLGVNLEVLRSGGHLEHLEAAL